MISRTVHFNRFESRKQYLKPDRRLLPSIGVIYFQNSPEPFLSFRDAIANVDASTVGLTILQALIGGKILVASWPLGLQLKLRKIRLMYFILSSFWLKKISTSSESLLSLPYLLGYLAHSHFNQCEIMPIQMVLSNVLNLELQIMKS